MKKSLFTLAFTSLAMGIFAQGLPFNGFKNTMWSGAGSSTESNMHLYGLTDTLQARLGAKNFVVDGMLTWGSVAKCDSDGDVDYFIIGSTEDQALTHPYIGNKTGINTGKQTDINTGKQTDSYYINFVWKPINILDIGFGTHLNWKVGPAPSLARGFNQAHETDCDTWTPYAHVRQGGLGTNYDEWPGRVSTYVYNIHDGGNSPGTVDVAGYIPYANVYAKEALGARLHFASNDDKVSWQLGCAVPSGVNTDHLRSNIGAEVSFSNLTIAASYEGFMQKHGNFYSGVEVGTKRFSLDGYFAYDNIGGGDDSAYGFGAAMNFGFSKIDMLLRPEAGLNVFSDSNYTAAWYIGCALDWRLSDLIKLGAWSSFAIGSEDDRWNDKDSEYYNSDYGTGHVFSLRPDITFIFNPENSLSAYVNIENREAYTGKSNNMFSTGIYYTYTPRLK